MSEHTYRWFSAIAGAVAGAVCVVGFVGLVYRRSTNVRVRRTTSRTDLLVYFLLVVLIGLGCWMTFAHNLITVVALRLPRLDLGVVALAVRPAARRRGRPGREHRLPGARDRRLGVLGAVPVQPPRARLEHPAAVPRPPLHPLPAPLREHVQPFAMTAARHANGRDPARARDLAFTACFYAWSLLGPLGPDLQDDLDLSDVQTSAMVAVPVLLGSLMRIPLGWLTDRHGGRRVFSALMAFTPLPLIALALSHDSLGVDPRLRVPARLRRRVVRRRRALRQRLVPARAPRASRWASTGWAWAAPCSPASPRRGSPTAGGSPRRSGWPPPSWSPCAPSSSCSPATRRGRREPVRRRACSPSLSVFRTSGRAWALTLFYFMAFGGFVAMFLYLPKLLTGVHDLTKADAGARAAGFALLAVIGRPLGGSLSDRVGAARVLLRLLLRRRRARARARRRLHGDGAAHRSPA